MPTPPLSDSGEQRRWLVDHIPYRIRAVLTGLPIDPPWRIPLSSGGMQRDPLANACAWAAIHEGRLSAMRWLIGFIGIKMDRNGGPGASKRGRDTDTFISDLPGGVRFDPNADGADTLATVWLGCSQAGGHATHGTEHPDISDTRLAAALFLVLTHLERSIYAKAGINLIELIRAV